MGLLRWFAPALLLATIGGSAHAEDAQVSQRVDALTRKVYGNGERKVRVPGSPRPDAAEIFRTRGLVGVESEIQSRERRGASDIRSLSADLAQRMKALAAATGAMPVGGKADEANPYTRDQLCGRAEMIMQHLTQVAVSVKALAADYDKTLDAIDVGADGADQKIRQSMNDFAIKLRDALAFVPGGERDIQAYYGSLKRVSSGLQQAYGVSRAADAKFADEASRAAVALAGAAAELKAAARDGVELLRLYEGFPAAKAEAAALEPLVDTKGSLTRVERARDALKRMTGPTQPPTFWTDTLAKEADAGSREAQDALARIDASKGSQERDAQVCPGQDGELPHRYEGVRLGTFTVIQNAVVGAGSEMGKKIKEYQRTAKRLIEENREIVKDRNARIELANERLAKIPANETDRREKILAAKRERQKQSEEATNRILQMELAMQNLGPAEAALGEQTATIQQAVAPTMRMMGVEGK